MAWNTQQQERTLYIRKNVNGKYQIEQFLDVVPLGATTVYQEPIPMETMGLRHMEFDRIEFIEGQTPIKRDSTASARNLTNTNNKGLQSRTAPA